MPREKLIFVTDAESTNGAKLFLEDRDGQRMALTGVTEIVATASEPFVRITMLVDANLEIELPVQTGELLKVVAKLQAELEAQR